jgi:ABC-type phosphate transport system auxiliary subunit
MRTVLAEKGFRFFSSSAVTQKNYKKIFDLAVEMAIKARSVPRRKRKEMNDSGVCSLI